MTNRYLITLLHRGHNCGREAFRVRFSLFLLVQTPIGEICETPIGEICETLIEEICETPIGEICETPIGEICETPIGEICEGSLSTTCIDLFHKLVSHQNITFLVETLTSSIFPQFIVCGIHHEQRSSVDVK